MAHLCKICCSTKENLICHRCCSAHVLSWKVKGVPVTSEIYNATESIDALVKEPNLKLQLQTLHAKKSSLEHRHREITAQTLETKRSIQSSMYNENSITKENNANLCSKGPDH